MTNRAENRYGRQSLFHELGTERQESIQNSRVAVVGIGALGCQSSTLLARAGVGRLLLIDRDFVEKSNLQRQVLFTEDDAHLSLPKAEAARQHLEAVNSEIVLEAHVSDVSSGNIEALLGNVDLIVDGSDNFEVRYLINDFAVKNGLPWIYAAAVGASGLMMPVIPQTTACLRCVFEEPPPVGSAATCDTAGVLGPNTSFVASLASLEALKILAGREDAVRRGLCQVDLWANEIRSIEVDGPRENCPCCGEKKFPYLEAPDPSLTTRLCGRDAVQISPSSAGSIDLGAIREKVSRATEVADNGFLLRFDVSGLEVTLFPDGRAILKGTSDPDVARTVYARYVGS